MTALTNADTAGRWRHHGRAPVVRLFLSPDQDNALLLADQMAGGFQISVETVDAGAAIELDRLNGADAAVVEVRGDDPASIARFEALAAHGTVPLLAAAHEPPIALFRALIRAGAHDVVTLPLDLADLETSLAPLRQRIAGELPGATTTRGKVISVIKSVGGVGATALLTQLAVRYAANERQAGRDTCLIDFDLQFGDAVFQLGLSPSLSLADLLSAGTRLDGDLLRATTVEHSSGLRLIAAPPEVMPLDAVSNEQVIDIVDHATREYSTLFVDLPSNWSNWSLSLVARSDLVLLVTELNVASLHRARRQLDLLRSQDLGEVDVRLVVNRHEKGLFKTIRPGHVAQTLGVDVDFTIANDHPLIRAAIDRGLPVEEIRRKTPLAKDLDTLDAGIVAAFGRER